MRGSKFASPVVKHHEIIVRPDEYREHMSETNNEVREEFFDARDASLEDAKRWLRTRFTKGATCPCCKQFVKLYKRNFNKSMAYVLLLIECYYRGDLVEEWLHVPSYIAEMVSDHPRRAAAVRGDWAKMKLWGLLEEKPGKREDGSPRVGYYRMTDLGHRFARREVKVPAHVYIYNGEPLRRVVSDEITIDDALGTEFNYDQIMSEA